MDKLSFYIQDAIEHGTNKAVLLYHIRNKVDYYRSINKNFHNGRYWFYSSSQKLHELFNFIPRRTISRYLQELEKAGIIISKNLNRVKYDKTKHYSILKELERCQSSSKNTRQITDSEFISYNSHLLGEFEKRCNAVKKDWKKIEHIKKEYPEYKQFGL